MGERYVRRAVDLLVLTWRHPANTGRRTKKLIENAAFQFNGRVRGRRHLATIGDRSRFWADVGQFVSARGVVANPPEWPEMLVWSRFLRPGSTFVDIGANIGLYTLWAIEQGARVVAFEPHPEIAGLLRENLELNGYDVEVVQKALGSSAGKMFLTADKFGANHLVAEADGTVVEVDVARLDDVLVGRVVDGMKIDVEGAERLVLSGAEETLRGAGLVQVEWNAQSDVNFGEPRGLLRSLLRDAGFVLTRADDDGTLRRVTDPEPDDGLNLFAVSERRDDALALLG